MLGTSAEAGLICKGAIRAGETEEPCGSERLCSRVWRACCARGACLQGIEGIRKVFLREAKRTRLDRDGGQGFVTDNEWVLDTEGQ